MKNFKIGYLFFGLLFFFPFLAFAQKVSKQDEISSVYELKMTSLDGQEIDFSEFKDKVLLIVNTASKCGFTNQYKGLEELNQKYSEKGLVVLGFPCNQFLAQEPGENDEIREFCTANYGVSFQMFEKIDVNGANASPLYKFLKEKAPFEGFKDKEMGDRLSSILSKYYPEYLGGNEIRWNFTKFIVSKDGEIIMRFESPTTPKELEEVIEKLL